MGRLEQDLIRPILTMIAEVIPKVVRGVAEGQARYATSLHEAADAFERTDKRHLSPGHDPEPQSRMPSRDAAGPHPNTHGDTVRRRWTPADEAGPLTDGYPANTFRSGTYDEVVLAEDTRMYRVVTVDGNPNGGFWTREKPTGPLQSQLDSALLPEWKLRDPHAERLVTKAQATHYVESIVPKGTVIYEGAAGHQAGRAMPGSSLVGGGAQVYVPEVPTNWLVKGMHRLIP
jgi:hypothetical protein